MTDTEAGRGATVLIDTNSLSVANPAGFVTHELWYGTNGAGSHWVEVGVIDGSACCGLGTVNQSVFWCNNSNAGTSPGLHCHPKNNTWSMDNYHSATVSWAGQTGAWNVWFQGEQLGTATGNDAGTGRHLSAGIEATEDGTSDHAGGFMRDWKRQDSNGAWHDGWDASSAFAFCPAGISVSGLQSSEGLHE
jgi:hypothetical protein